MEFPSAENTNNVRWKILNVYYSFSCGPLGLTSAGTAGSLSTNNRVSVKIFYHGTRNIIHLFTPLFITKFVSALHYLMFDIKLL